MLRTHSRGTDAGWTGVEGLVGDLHFLSSRSITSQEPSPGPDLPPWPLPHLPTVTMETQALLPLVSSGIWRRSPFLWFWWGRANGG